MTTFYTSGPWGTGKLSRLTPTELDNNFWDILQRLDALENADPSAVVISNISVLGNQMMIYLSNGGNFGPFTLPTAMLQYRDEYAIGQSYNKLDLFSVKQSGLWFVEQPFTATVAFDPTLIDVDGNPYYTKVFGEGAYVNDISFSYPGKPGQGVNVDETFMEFIFVRPGRIPADFARSKAKLGVVPSDTLVLPVSKNGTNIGTLTFAAGQSVGVFAWTVVEEKTFAISDVLGVKRPATLDVTARRLVATVASTVDTE